MELFNEFMIIIVVYHYMMFTNFCTNNKVQFNFGWSKIVFLCIISFVNITLMVVKLVETAKRKKKMAELKEIHEKEMVAQLEALEAERKYRIKNKERRTEVRKKLDLRAMW